MNNISVRKASLSDAASICEISSRDLGYECDFALVKAKISMLSDERECVFVAEFEGVVAGYIHVEKYDVLYYETMANLLGLAVKDEFQKMGIGKALVLASEDWAKSHGIKLMRVNSGMSRSGAHEFYRHLGYDSEKQQIRFMKKL